MKNENKIELTIENLTSLILHNKNQYNLREFTIGLLKKSLTDCYINGYSKGFLDAADYQFDKNQLEIDAEKNAEKFIKLIT